MQNKAGFQHTFLEICKAEESVRRRRGGGLNKEQSKKHKGAGATYIFISRGVREI